MVVESPFFFFFFIFPSILCWCCCCSNWCSQAKHSIADAKLISLQQLTSCNCSGALWWCFTFSRAYIRALTVFFGYYFCRASKWKWWWWLPNNRPPPSSPKKERERERNLPPLAKSVVWATAKLKKWKKKCVCAWLVFTCWLLLAQSLIDTVICA